MVGWHASDMGYMIPKICVIWDIRFESVPYNDLEALETALQDENVTHHATICRVSHLHVCARVCGACVRVCCVYGFMYVLYIDR